MAPNGVSPSSPEWHRGHRDQHLAKYPRVDLRTIEALDELVEMAERRQIVDAVGPMQRRGEVL